MSEAAAAFKEAARLDPQDAGASYSLGVTLQKLGKHEEAAAALKRATELQKDWAEAFYFLSLSYLDLGQQEKAVTAAKEAARLKPDDFAILNGLAHALRDSKKFDEAIEPVKHIVQLRPDDVNSLYLLGNTYLMAQKYDQAIETLTKVVAMDPDHADARDRLRAATARKRERPMLEEYKKDVAERPNDALAHTQLGHSYNGLGMFAESETEYLRALELDPTNADFNNSLAIDYDEWGKTEKAIQYYQKAIDLKPNHVFYLSLGAAYEKLGKLEDAARAYQESIKIKPTFTYALYNLALLDAKQDRPQEAIELLRKVVQLDPRHVFAQHALGVLYVRTGEKSGAMQQYDILQTLNPKLAADLLKMIPK
jgi:tetratricopeptide (TPR) repeat protein